MKWQLQWKIRVPWGTLALTSRGHPDGEPVFCVHGRQDSSSVFGPLVDLMPNMNHYVCLDMPGNGLSDGFPPGPKLMRFHFLMAMELAIAHLGWDHFIFIGHSMGCEQGLFFNAIHPNRITKMVLLDANPTLMRMQVEDPAEYQRAFFDNYYEHFHRENFERKTHTRISAMRSLARARDLNDSQCADLLQRNFHTKSEAAQWHPIEKWHPNEAIAPRVMLILNDKDRITDIIKAFTKEEQRIAKLTGVKPNQADRGKRLTEYIVRNQLGVVDNSPPKSQINEEAFREIMENEDLGCEPDDMYHGRPVKGWLWFRDR
ncbi:serine hydrolase-like protein 2 isoform X3 [Helicoverpa zea]|uniref:serine hydrolase-like protein 2 isoform X3 n=1 Tax=Helicoverpa zea TaxID=7113 RepID=UPI001F58D049|nr:serine hydrolase-like protein 2 isoform X3 [Helicoverpa zea]